MEKQKNGTGFLSKLTFQPLTKDNWNKFLELFGEKGAGANCWCMHFRLSKSDHEEGKENDGNKNAMKELVWNDKPTGLLAFYEDIPVAWCAFSPREDFIRLQNSRVHKPIDHKKVWSVPCTFVKKEFRKNGVSIALLKGLVNYAKKQGIKTVEAYPTIPTQEKLPDGFAWIGLYKSFEKAGFKIVDKTSKHRPMVRYYVD
ncbi:MAG: GNAT family N-acetyltransferase [Bacteroidota bacterium]